MTLAGQLEGRRSGEMPAAMDAMAGGVSTEASGGGCRRCLAEVGGVEEGESDRDFGEAAASEAFCGETGGMRHWGTAGRCMLEVGQQEGRRKTCSGALPPLPVLPKDCSQGS
mmetsp:Transcript_44006/g.112116  ORF Transcript_44006/g.112116 Transcript_44006/m.112116 type:complete len:112 (-) Transcript_44006:581-916(-)